LFEDFYQKLFFVLIVELCAVLGACTIDFFLKYRRTHFLISGVELVVLHVAA